MNVSRSTRAGAGTTLGQGRPRGSWAVLAGVAATSAVAAALTAGLADAAREHDGPSRVDPVVAADVLKVRTPLLTGLAHVVTFAGSEIVVGLIALLLLGALVLRREYPRALRFAVAMGGSAFLTVAVKLAVTRPRPGVVDRLGPVDTSYSFPSGHTLNSTVLLVLIVWLLWSRASTGHRTALVAAAMAMSVAVGASRVYLGYHWLTDVVASGLVATAWLCLVWVLSGPVLRPKVQPPVA
jgi:membrane-associated phospholipid phosphatase